MTFGNKKKKDKELIIIAPDDEPKKEKSAEKELKSIEMWNAAIAERNSTPQWSCDNNKVPIYKYKITVLLNEETKTMDDNIFELNEPLSISVAVDDNTDKKDLLQPVPNIGITFIRPDGKMYTTNTGKEGKVYFRPALVGKWTFIVEDIGISPWFNVVPKNE